MRAAALGGLVNHDDDDRFLLGLGANAGANQACLALALSLAGGRFTHAGEHVETSMELPHAKGRACTPSDGGVDAGAGPADGGAPVPCTLTEVKRLVVPPGAAVSGIADGKVLLGFAGGCAFGPILVGAALTMETGFAGVRTGDYDPPPFTPAAVVLPDGGLPESALDGGSDAGARAGRGRRRRELSRGPMKKCDGEAERPLDPADVRSRLRAPGPPPLTHARARRADPCAWCRSPASPRRPAWRARTRPRAGPRP